MFYQSKCVSVDIVDVAIGNIKRIKNNQIKKKSSINIKVQFYLNTRLEGKKGKKDSFDYNLFVSKTAKLI